MPAPRTAAVKSRHHPISRGGKPTHRLLVPMYDGGQYDVDALVHYDGPANWKLEPLDPKAHEDWEKVADPQRVALELERTRRTSFGSM